MKNVEIILGHIGAAYDAASILAAYGKGEEWKKIGQEAMEKIERLMDELYDLFPIPDEDDGDQE
ncbi:MAG: hypothetical protein JRI66_13235 [Deltaproteobacteria bacterium]|nr:hypothetical protein [Deltaproteobacteria bacterium]